MDLKGGLHAKAAAISAEKYVVEATGSEAKHILDLLQAEAQGRLLVLPCKVGDKVYTTEHLDGTKGVTEVAIHDIKVFLDSYFRNEVDWRFTPDSFGVTTFLTRDAAETA